MADELNIITKNRAGDGWVDQIPGPVSSGYQAQNTLISSTLIGIDKSEVSPATQGRVIVEPSGPIDVDGQPFMVTSRVTLSPPDRNGGYYYIKVANGSTWNKKTLMAVTPVDPPLYDHARRGLYLINSDGTRERCLNWMVYYPNQVTDSTSNSRPFRIAQPGRPRLQIENFLDINGTETDLNVRFAAGDVPLYSFASGSYDAGPNGKDHNVFISKPLGKAGGVFRIKFTTVPSTHGDMVGYGFTVRETAPGKTDIVKGSRSTDKLVSEDFNEDLSFSPYTNISLFLEVQYGGADNSDKYVNVRNFQICASQGVSSFMREMLNMTNFFEPGTQT